MKKQLLKMVLLLLLPMLGMAADGFVIKGKVTGIISGSVGITQFIHLTKDEKNEEVPPKVRIVNGEFVYAGKLEHPALVELKISTRSILVYLENTNYSLNCPLDSLSGTQLKGGQLNDDWQQFRTGTGTSLEYIKQHASSEIAAYLALRDYTSTLEKATSTRALLSPEALNTWSGQRLDATIAALTKASAGNAFPDLKMTNAQGQPFTVGSLAGKIVVFDFWASWCSPCRAYIPTLREHYRKYKAKGVQFVSVSVDDDKDKWYKALRELGMEWTQTLADGGFQDGKGVKEALHVFYIPHVIVMGKDGKIVANLDASKKDQLEKILDGLL